MAGRGRQRAVILEATWVEVDIGRYIADVRFQPKTDGRQEECEAA
jgi:hypothetical protein